MLGGANRSFFSPRKRLRFERQNVRRRVADDPRRERVTSKLSGPRPPADCQRMAFPTRSQILRREPFGIAGIDLVSVFSFRVHDDLRNTIHLRRCKWKLQRNTLIINARLLR